MDEKYAVMPNLQNMRENLNFHSIPNLLRAHENDNLDASMLNLTVNSGSAETTALPSIYTQNYKFSEFRIIDKTD